MNQEAMKTGNQAALAKGFGAADQNKFRVEAKKPRTKSAEAAT
jgi:hypothetical protein